MVSAVCRKLEPLKVLDLRRNSIGLRGFTVVSDAVDSMPSLQCLYMDDNNITDSKAMAWDRVLKQDFLQRSVSAGLSLLVAQSLCGLLWRQGRDQPRGA